MIHGEMKWLPIQGTTFSGGKGYTGPIGASALVRVLRTETIPQGMADGAVQLATDMETYATENAAWINRTGQAREELAGVPFAEGGEVGASIVHGAPHGVFLENMEARPDLAIIRLTQHAFSPIAARIIEGGVRAALEGRGSRVRGISSGRFSR